MKRLTEKIMEHAERLLEGTPLVAEDLTHLGTRIGVNRALARLAKRGELLRAERGIYFCPVKSRFGTHPPSIYQAIEGLGEQRGETIVQNGASAANDLGLIIQVPMRYIFLTSGRTRYIMLGNHKIKLRHAPPWQLVLAGHPAGQVLRALAWLGPEETESAIQRLKRKIPSEAFDIMAGVAHRLPNWLARSITRTATHA